MRLLESERILDAVKPLVQCRHLVNVVLRWSVVDRMVILLTVHLPKDGVFFAGESFTCSLTFTNVSSSSSPSSLSTPNQVTSTHQSNGLSRKISTLARSDLLTPDANSHNSSIPVRQTASNVPTSNPNEPQKQTVILNGGHEGVSSSTHHGDASLQMTSFSTPKSTYNTSPNVAAPKSPAMPNIHARSIDNVHSQYSAAQGSSTDTSVHDNSINGLGISKQSPATNVKVAHAFEGYLPDDARSFTPLLSRRQYTPKQHDWDGSILPAAPYPAYPSRTDYLTGDHNNDNEEHEEKLYLKLVDYDKTTSASYNRNNINVRIPARSDMTHNTLATTPKSAIPELTPDGRVSDVSSTITPSMSSMSQQKTLPSLTTRTSTDSITSSHITHPTQQHSLHNSASTHTNVEDIAFGFVQMTGSFALDSTVIKMNPFEELKKQVMYRPVGVGIGIGVGGGGGSLFPPLDGGGANASSTASSKAGM